jgi:hypothetical protein
LMNAAVFFGLVYFGIGLLINIFIMGGKSFTEGTKGYQKALGAAFMVVLWPIVLSVLGSDRRQ